MTLNPEQRSAVESKHPVTVVIAGPGSGKTRVLVERIKWLLGQGVKARDIVAITFTNAAADEIKSRLNLDKATIGLGFIGTLHGWMLRLLRMYGPTIGLAEDLTVIDEETAEAIMDETQRELRYKGTKTAVKDSLANIRNLWHVSGLVESDRVAVAYRTKLIQAGLLDYDSILDLGHQLLGAFAAKSQMELPIASGRHLLVDEFQDSGATDNSIYALAAFEEKFYVGDPDQSIYAFRGACPQHILSKAQAFKAETIYLQENYRSAESIATAANALILRNIDRLPKKIVTTRKEPGVFIVNQSETESAMVVLIVRDFLSTTQARLERTAVLCRYNWQASLVAQALRDNGIPVHQVETVKKPEDWHAAKLVVAFYAHPDNNRVAYQLLKHTQGPASAAEAQSQAAKAMQSINEIAIHAGTLPVAQILEALGRARISVESREIVSAAIVRFKPRDLVELGLALAEPELFAREESSGGVFVGTIHSSKGREWPHVVLPWWNQENFPGTKQGAVLEEERRLAFVAITRARDSVAIFYSNTARLFEAQRQAVRTAPSRFIAETLPKPV